MSVEALPEILAWREEQRARAAARQSEYDKARLDRRREVVKAWKQRNPEKVRAHKAVARALKTGRLVKKPCEMCGDARAFAHHDDYSHPLAVRWLCRTHHTWSHAA